MQESSMFNEHLVLLLPAAVYSLSTGCAPFKQCHSRLPPFYASQDVNGAMNDWVKVICHGSNGLRAYTY